MDNTGYNNIIESSGTKYSKITGWEVWNFMTIEHGKVLFDESNILNFKGYNSSGKSAMLRALDVVLFNIKPNSQVSFIQDDTEYFRIMVYFDDDVIILRDKYINGQSLYEMYKDNEVIFSTKQNGHLTKVSEVPKPIADYLGLISYNGIMLNSRSCFEKQLLVMTSGSENYGFLNSVLKSEELAVASETLNVDKNKLSSDINTLETQLSIYKESYKDCDGVTEEILNSLKIHDSALDECDSRVSCLSSISQLYTNMALIPNIPELGSIDTERLNLLSKVISTYDTLSSIPDLPELPTIDGSRLDLISSIKNAYTSLSNIPSIPELVTLDLEQLNLLASIQEKLQSYQGVCREIEDNDTLLSNLSAESKELVAVMEEFGNKYTRCPNCGALVESGSAHTD